jgi:hypothetical protein
MPEPSGIISRADLDRLADLFGQYDGAIDPFSAACQSFDLTRAADPLRAFGHATLPGAAPESRWRSILGRLYLFMARSHSSMLKRTMRPIFTNGKMRRRIKWVIVRRSQR